MKAAFYECDITPPIGGLMWGYYMKAEATDVIDRLYAKAAVIEDDGEYAAVVCVDTCVVPPEMHEIVTKRIHEYTGLEPSCVCICSNHTHRGAPVSDSPEINCFADAAYRDVFFRLAADAVILAYMRLDSAEAFFGKSNVENISFNRNFVLNNGSAITHGGERSDVIRPLAGVDPSLCVMTFERDGKPIGAIINFACHQDCTGGVPGYSGDYSSILSEELKKVYGKDFVSLFVLGTCGDVIHNDPKAEELPRGWYREMGKIFARETLTIAKHSEPVGKGVAVIKETVKIKKRLADFDKTMGRLSELLKTEEGMMRIRNLVYYNAVNTDTEAELYVQCIKIGNVCLHALPGEVYVNFGLKLKEKSPFERCMVIENSNSYCGYVPTEEAFTEGYDLYETSLCNHSCLVPQAGEILISKSLELAERLL